MTCISVNMIAIVDTIDTMKTELLATDAIAATVSVE
jgi:hypothetical protein